jgi:hypothetical protein
MVGFKVGSRVTLLAGGGLVAAGLLASCAPPAGSAFVLGSVSSFHSASGSPAYSTFELAYTCSSSQPVTYTVNLLGSLPSGKTTPLEGTKTPIKASCTGDQQTVDVTTFPTKGGGGVASGGAGVVQGLATITEFDNGIPHYTVQQVDIEVEPQP